MRKSLPAAPTRLNLSNGGREELSYRENLSYESSLPIPFDDTYGCAAVPVALALCAVACTALWLVV